MLYQVFPIFSKWNFEIFSTSFCILYNIISKHDYYLKNLGYLHEYWLFTIVMWYVYFYFHFLNRIYSFTRSFIILKMEKEIVNLNNLLKHNANPHLEQNKFNEIKNNFLIKKFKMKEWSLFHFSSESKRNIRFFIKKCWGWMFSKYKNNLDEYYSSWVLIMPFNK